MTPKRPPSDGAPAANDGESKSTSTSTSTDAPEAELISFPRKSARGAHPSATDHLAANRSLIVRRSLLATAVGVVPIPVMDDYLASRVRAGMLMQIADRRSVDLTSSSAELLADPREGTAARNATMTAATLLALKLAWRKIFLLLGAGLRAEEMATTFQVGTLFDHYCARLHVGSGVEREAAVRIRGAALASIRESERAAIIGVFRDGGRMLGRSIGEAPGWVSRQLRRSVEQYVASGGNPDAVPDDRDSTPDPTQAADARWLDRAASFVEDRLVRLGDGYLESLLGRFDHHLAAKSNV